MLNLKMFQLEDYYLSCHTLDYTNERGYSLSASDVDLVSQRQLGTDIHSFSPNPHEIVYRKQRFSHLLITSGR